MYRYDFRVSSSGVVIKVNGFSHRLPVSLLYIIIVNAVLCWPSVRGLGSPKPVLNASYSYVSLVWRVEVAGKTTVKYANK